MSFRVDNVTEQSSLNGIANAPDDTKKEFTYSSLVAGGAIITSNLVFNNVDIEVYADDLKRMALNGSGVDMSSSGVNDFLSLGTQFIDKDTPEYARELMESLGILEVDATVVLRLNYISNANSNQLRFVGGSTTTNHLQFKLFNGTASTEVIIGLPSAVPQYGDIVIIVKCNNATPGQEQVEFNCVKQATPAP